MIDIVSIIHKLFKKLFYIKRVNVLKVQKYKHDSDFSYTLGATLTYELLKAQPELLKRVFINSSTETSDGISSILEICKSKNIPVECSDKAFNILSPKGNCFVIGEFSKSSQAISDGDHIVLVNPSDAGNLGTIIRTAVGFGFHNIAIVHPAVDIYDPRTVRATMGALFHVSVEYFDSIEEYRERFPQNKLYAFMLTSSKAFPSLIRSKPYSLVFGNEATGLPSDYANFCTAVRIMHSSDIDSLNLPMAAGIAMYEFTKEFWRN